MSLGSKVVVGSRQVFSFIHNIEIKLIVCVCGQDDEPVGPAGVAYEGLA